MKLTVRTDIISYTLSILQAAGERNQEGIALWFGKKDGCIRKCLEPIHRAGYGMFHIPQAGIAQILDFCKTERVRLLAQVHSHPGAAFHSEADDRWAIPRHEGAISIVIPAFARSTSINTFIDDAAIYSLSEQGLWTTIKTNDTAGVIEVSP